MASDLTSNTASHTASALFAGRQMFSRYTMQRLLGRGGMGVVWLARDEKLDRLVALKFLPDVCFLDSAARDDLKRETRRSLELTHPNIVRIYDFVEDDEAAAISMEYIDGATLSHLRVEREDRCFAPAELGSWVGDLCRALDYAHHGACIVHRDLKPGNLMVTTRGALKITDFGIACGLHNTAARVSAWNSTGGTLGYMSPQQLAGELAAPSDDIYSVGALLYELLTSRPPFYSGDISLQIRTIVPPSIEQRRTELGIVGGPIPTIWQETIAACLAKTPHERPASASEVAQRLGLSTSSDAPREETALHLRTVIERPITATLDSKKTPWLAMLQRHWIPAVATGAALVGILGSTLHFRSKTPAPTAPAPIVQTTVREPGGVMVKTDPPGAKVTVGGYAAGNTPAALSGIPAGAHTVLIELDGFEKESVPAEVRAQQFADLGTVILRRSTGTLQVVTEPPDSSYTLLAADGRTVVREGFTPETVPQLPTGHYSVRFARQGWPTEERELTVERESTQVTRHRFATGTLVLVTDPPGAAVTSAGREFGVSPLQLSLPNGPHVFSVALAGYTPATFQATLEAGKTTTPPPLLLKPEPPKLQVTTTPSGVPFQLVTGAVESPGAEVIGQGTAPALIEELTPGPYRVIFGGGKWPQRSMAVELAPRGVSTVEAELPHATASIESTPVGAEIYSGDDLLGVTPLKALLPAGEHVFTAEFGDRKSRPRTVTLAVDENKTVRFDFTTSSETSQRSRREKKAKPEESTFTKIGRSITNLFSGPKKK